MAEEAKKKEEKAPAHDKGHDKADGEKKGGGLMTKLPVLLGGAMIIEAVVLFAGFKFLGGSPKAAEGSELSTVDPGHGADAASGDTHGAPEDAHGAPAGDAHGGGAAPAKIDKNKIIEVEIVKAFRAPNKQTGRTFLYDVEIMAVTRGEHEAKVTETLKSRAALIKDRIRTIISQIDPEKLGGGQEPGLETLRRQVKHQLDEILGEGIIDEVLVPKCIPFRTDF